MSEDRQLLAWDEIDEVVALRPDGRRRIWRHGSIWFGTLSYEQGLPDMDFYGSMLLLKKKTELVVNIYPQTSKEAEEAGERWVINDVRRERY